MAPDPVAFEAFETVDDAIVVFLGAAGAHGLLLLRGADRWEFFGTGTVEWGDLHQQVLRNGRARRLDAAALAARGLVLPPLDEYRARPPGQWTDRFPIEMPTAEVPHALRARLGTGALTVHLVLFEDRYETSLGDGKFLYPEAAFAERGTADAWIRRKVAAADAESRQWHEYTIRPVVLRLDAGRGVLLTDPQGPYEHWAIRDVVSHLALT